MGKMLGEESYINYKLEYQVQFIRVASAEVGMNPGMPAET